MKNILIEVEGNNVTLNWTAPFSLNLTGVEPDITYCVEVISATTSMVTECDIHVPMWTYISTVPLCDRLTFVVTPVNLAGNGTSTNRELTPDRKFQQD